MHKSLNLKNHFDFYGKVTGNLHAHSASSMTAGLTKNFKKKIAGAVDDRRCVGKAWCNIDHPQYLDHTHHIIQTADQAFYCLQTRERRQRCSLVTLLQAYIFTDFPYDLFPAKARNLPGRINQVAGSDGVHEFSGVKVYSV